MAPPAWTMAVALAACAPLSSYGIRQETAAELLGLNIAQDGNDETSLFAEQRRKSGAAPHPAPATESHDVARWSDGDWNPCKPVGDTMNFTYESGKKCIPQHMCVYDGGNGWSDVWDNWRPCRSPPPTGWVTAHPGKPGDHVYSDGGWEPCKKIGDSFEFVYESGKKCFPKHLCMYVEGQGWLDGMHDYRPCDPVAPGGSPAHAAAIPGKPGDVVYSDKNWTPCKEVDDDSSKSGFVYESGKTCFPQHMCAFVPGEGFVDGWNNSHPCDPGSSGDLGEPGSPVGHASATDDPHLVSLAGERFDVKQPGRYSLLRVPSGDKGSHAGERETPLLALDADLRAPEGAPCGLYIKMLALSGRWLDGKVVRIRPSSSGGGGAGQQRSFSVQVAAAASEAALVMVADGQPWAPFGSPEANESLAGTSTGMVRALAVRREELGPFSEGQAFRFELLDAGSGQRPPASITVSQGSHQALNVALEGMGHLGHARLGGLLGTEPHDRGLEVPTKECREMRAQGKVGSLLLGLSSPLREPAGGGNRSSRMQAAWT